MSVNRDSENTKNHFFADLSSNKQNQTLDLHLEGVSNDTYLRKNNITSPIIKDNSSLHSYVNYSTFNEDSSFEIRFEVFEDLNKQKSDRYEYIFPNFNYEKYLNTDGNMNGNLTFNSRGYQKNYNTNSDEVVLINEFGVIRCSHHFPKRATYSLSARRPMNAFKFIYRRPGAK